MQGGRSHCSFSPPPPFLVLCYNILHGFNFNATQLSAQSWLSFSTEIQWLQHELRNTWVLEVSSGQFVSLPWGKSQRQSTQTCTSSITGVAFQEGEQGKVPAASITDLSPYLSNPTSSFHPFPVRPSILRWTFLVQQALLPVSVQAGKRWLCFSLLQLGQVSCSNCFTPGQQLLQL